jgi:hypothetical protein
LLPGNPTFFLSTLFGRNLFELTFAPGIDSGLNAVALLFVEAYKAEANSTDSGSGSSKRGTGASAVFSAGEELRGGKEVEPNVSGLSTLSRETGLSISGVLTNCDLLYKALESTWLHCVLRAYQRIQ